MSGEAYAYDVVNLGAEAHPVSRSGYGYDVVNVGVQAQEISPNAYGYDLVNLGHEAIPTIFYDRPQAGWGFIGNPEIPLGQISAASDGYTYDTADVTT